MADPLVTCPLCSHPTRKHNASGCTVGGRFDSCWCGQTPEDINPPEPKPVDLEAAVPEPVAFEPDYSSEDVARLLEARGNVELAAELRAFVADQAAEEAGQPEVWSAAVPPGGYVCAVPDPERPDGICGMPTESEPCSEHDPARTLTEPAPKRTAAPAKLATPAKRRGRPPKAAAAAAPPATSTRSGEVLGTWYPWACLSCGSRRFEAHYCCGAPALPVTLTMTRGHGDA